ncbi:uncharacterized protein LOC131285821 [Anopheles ziemanni]|uniref:uncharacterized protein LOC131269447 n=1 Tax=Anopheles coustani TaxID=139045 RepID=UPI00265AD0DE|nr:uncharacterized protein LOC131269447 [Anopheles coustani]XP_058170658.1 uncharacterized protein LOC131285821 [Anopheles ziemanni]
MASCADDGSLVEYLLAEEKAGRENLDFFLQKHRIEEVFEELLKDLEALGRVEFYFGKGQENEKDLWNKFRDALESQRTSYEDLRKLLTEFEGKIGKADSVEDGTSPFFQEILQRIQHVADKSLLRSPSPPVVIKNRAEQETFRWTRLIMLQETQLESLKRKIEEYKRKIAERQTQRRELQLQSSQEKDYQTSASNAVLVDIKLSGDGVIQRLQEEISSHPPFESTPEYQASLDRSDQKRKRIAKLHVQLQLWIKKYDKFIGEPMPSLLELEERMAGLEEWKETVLKPQEERLQELKEQVGEFEAIAFEEKVEEMRKLHAVRVLQRAWKRTLEVKRSKKSKKGKKGKGKKRK